MTYVKPGVTVKQVQTTVSPNLAPPSLSSCIVGLGYEVVETTDQSEVYTDGTFGTVQTYDTSSATTAYIQLGDDATLESSSVYVDILVAGQWNHIASADFSVNGPAATVTISGGAASTATGQIAIGYRATLSGLNQYFIVDSLSDIEAKVGKVTHDNPLAFGLSQALQNANSVVAAYGVLEDTTAEHTNARDALALQEVYALAPMTHTSVESAYASYVTAQSAQAIKKERIVFLNSKWTWYESDGSTTTTGPNDVQTDKAGTVTGLAASAAAVANKRVFSVNPDTVYVEEKLPIAKIKQSYLTVSNSLITTYNLFAQFTSSWTYDDGTTKKLYYAGDDITDAVHTRLFDNTNGFPDQDITVSIPVPGYFLAAADAGKVSGERPEQPFTNLPIAGDFTQLKFSGDFFTEAQLDTLAGGGNYVMWQPNTASVISSRHQLSTNRSSVELQELSITKSLDFTAKFIRDGLAPYIGRYNITPSFLNLIRTLINGYGAFLRREGYVNDVKIVTVEQDGTSADTINVTISVLVKYPVNYIKITLQF